MSTLLPSGRSSCDPPVWDPRTCPVRGLARSGRRQSNSSCLLVAGPDGDVQVEGGTRRLVGVGRNCADYGMRDVGEDLIDIVPPAHRWPHLTLQRD